MSLRLTANFFDCLGNKTIKHKILLRIRSHYLIGGACQNVTELIQLRDLILLEEYKNCMPECTATYISEQKVTNVSKAAVLTEEFVLKHKNVFFFF